MLGDRLVDIGGELSREALVLLVARIRLRLVLRTAVARRPLADLPEAPFDVTGLVPSRLAVFIRL